MSKIRINSSSQKQEAPKKRPIKIRGSNNSAQHENKGNNKIAKYLIGVVCAVVVLFIFVIVAVIMTAPDDLTNTPADTIKAGAKNTTSIAAEPSPQQTKVDKPIQDADVKAFFERTGSYTVSDGNEYAIDELVFNDFSKNKYTLKPTIGMGLSNSDEIQSYVHDAMWQGVFRVFAHVPADRLDVTITPQMSKNTTAKSEEMKRLKDFNVHIKITRAQALATLQKHTGIQSFDELVDLTDAVGNPGRLESKLFLTLRRDPIKSYLILRDIESK